MQPPTAWRRCPQGVGHELSSTAVLCPRGLGRHGPRLGRPQRRTVLTVEDALTRAQKEVIVEKLKTNLESSAVVFGMRMKGLSVPDVQKLRGSMPEEAAIIMCKNTLMKIACNEVEDMKPLEEFCKGDNAWVFSPEDTVAATVKAWFAFEEEMRKAKQATAPKGRKVPPVTEVTGGCMEGKALTCDEVKKLENVPTKKEVMAKIALALKMIPTRIANGVKPDTHIVKMSRGIKQIPQQLAYAAKGIAELDDDKTKVAKDTAKPQST